MATLQVKGIDETLYRALQARALREQRSTSQQVVRLIHDFLARPAPSAEEATRAFLALAGSWGDPRPARVVAGSLRRHRRTRRRFAGGGDVFA